MQKELQEYINAEISKLQFNRPPANLYDPLKYTLFGGGKRLRPVLTLMGCYLFKKDYKEATLPAIGIELFHNFTLMHDDIMDNAPIRRGVSTVHEKWNANIAILSGDATFVKAYEMICSVDDKILRRVLNNFNDTAMHVCEGQQFDMDFESDNNVNIIDYLKMITLKTAALLGFSLRLGGIIGGADEKDEKILYDTGINMGLAFQIKDDLLDVYSQTEKFGKKRGGDIVSNKKTYLILSALEMADEKQKEELNYWFGKEDADENEKIKAVTKIYDDLNIKNNVNDAVELYYNKALDTLDRCKVSAEYKEILLNFFRELLNRER